jgi:PD-(D/E)XK endonuclease
MEHPKSVGDQSTLAIMVALQLLGIPILIPFGENTRYDLVIDEEGRLGRVQCKTGRLRGGALRFATCSAYGHHRDPLRARRDYRGEVDYFAVYCPETAGVYLVPIADVPTTTRGCLRVAPARNNQSRGIRAARQYEIARVSSRRLGDSGVSA